MKRNRLKIIILERKYLKNKKDDCEQYILNEKNQIWKKVWKRTILERNNLTKDNYEKAESGKLVKHGFEKRQFWKGKPGGQQAGQCGQQVEHCGQQVGHHGPNPNLGGGGKVGRRLSYIPGCAR